MIAFSVGLFAAPVAALDHDPLKGLPWKMKERPNGDETGWNEADSEGGFIIDKVDLFNYLFSKYIKVFIAPKYVITAKNQVEQNATDNNGQICTNRTTPTR